MFNLELPGNCRGWNSGTSMEHADMPLDISYQVTFLNSRVKLQLSGCTYIVQNSV